MEVEQTVKERLQKLSSIGSDPTGGLTRLLYSDSWLSAQHYVQDQMKNIGMKAAFDEVGNLFGRIEGSELPEETIMTGSHIDTVVNGGKLDGQFGVVASLTAVQMLQEKYGQPKRSLEVISMAEEEGSRFPTVFWGSKNFVGIANNDEVKDIADANGKKFVDEMHRQGFDFQPQQKRRNDIKAFVEEHIEQGSILETEKECSCTVKKQATENNRETASTTLFRTKDQKISILRKSKLLDFPTMPTTAESLPLLIYFFLYTLNLYLVKCRQHHGSAFGWTIPTKHRSRQ